MTFFFGLGSWKIKFILRTWSKTWSTRYPNLDFTTFKASFNDDFWVKWRKRERKKILLAQCGGCCCLCSLPMLESHSMLLYIFTVSNSSIITCLVLSTKVVSLSLSLEKREREKKPCALAFLRENLFCGRLRPLLRLWPLLICWREQISEKKKSFSMQNFERGRKNYAPELGIK